MLIQLISILLLKIIINPVFLITKNKFENSFLKVIIHDIQLKPLMLILLNHNILTIIHHVNMIILIKMDFVYILFLVTYSFSQSKVTFWFNTLLQTNSK